LPPELGRSPVRLQQGLLDHVRGVQLAPQAGGQLGAGQDQQVIAEAVQLQVRAVHLAHTPPLPFQAPPAAGLCARNGAEDRAERETPRVVPAGWVAAGCQGAGTPGPRAAARGLLAQDRLRPRRPFLTCGAATGWPLSWAMRS